MKNIANEPKIQSLEERIRQLEAKVNHLEYINSLTNKGLQMIFNHMKNTENLCPDYMMFMQNIEVFMKEKDIK